MNDRIYPKILTNNLNDQAVSKEKPLYLKDELGRYTPWNKMSNTILSRLS